MSAVLKTHPFFGPFILSLLFSLITNVAWAKTIPDTVPAPNWIDKKTPNFDFVFPENSIEGGVYYLLVDTQIKVEEEKQPHYFYHYSDYIVNQTGVENNSQINISYDPIYEKVLIHEINIIRDGTYIDKTESSRMQVIQRENDLEKLIYSGVHTLNIILGDVRAGDIIDYSYSIIGANPVYRGYFSYHQALEWATPVEDISVRLLWHKKTELTPSLRNSDAEIFSKKLINGTEYTLNISKSPGREKDKDAPEWYHPWAHLYFSELESWASIVDWGLTLYNGVYDSNKEIESLAKKIKSDSSNKKEQIYQALNFTQNEVRYMGIELGSNSHIPSLASETLARRYGDCKDKTVLLITILKQLGIEAYPVLVNTRLKEHILNRPISPRMFNHVITKVYLENDEYYLDPTRTYQYGDLSNIYYPRYGAALELKTGNTKPTILPAASDNSSVTIEETFTLSSSPFEPVHSQTKSVYRGWNAERERSYYEDSGKKTTQKNFLEFFEKYYSDSEVHEELRVEDDRRENSFSYIETYKINKGWAKHESQQHRYDFMFYANIVDSYITFQDSSKRKDPIYVSHPTKVSQRITVNMPEYGWKFDNENFNKSSDYFDFDYYSKFDPSTNTLTLFFSYVTKTDVVMPEDYPEYVEDLDLISNYLSYGIYWNYKGDTTIQSDSFSMTPFKFMIMILAVFVAICVLWRVDKRKHPDPETGYFYPVALPKLIAMWVLTFGFYGCYWFYRNFKYIKEQETKPSMPLARGIFSQFWYYPLWRKLSHDSINRYQEDHLPVKSIAVVLALIYFVTIFAGNADFLTVPALFAGSFLILPMANYISFVNGENEARKHYSRWTFHHYLLALVSIPLLMLTFTSEIGLTPKESVVKGDQLLSFDIVKLHKRGVISPEENIIYFYSDGFLSVQEDGNGFTQKGVFSYWQDENGFFNLQKAAYEGIKDIKVDWNKEFMGNSIVTIIRKDDSEFSLYVSNDKKKDVKFVDSLKHYWLMNK